MSANNTPLEGMQVAIFAMDGVENVELTEPGKALEQAGAKTTLFSPKKGKIQSVNHMDKADQIEVDATIEEADPANFDAVLLPGGAVNADHLRVQPRAQEFVRSMDREGKPIAVICHGSWLLVSAGLVRGRYLTSYHTIQDDIRNAGGKWQDAETVRDSNWISSRQPSDIPMFNRAMIELFTEKKSAREEKTRRAA